MAKENHQFFIGTSGWHYKHWRGNFYPTDIKAPEQFGYYAGHFNTVEINNSFYRLPSEATFQGWKENSPDGFVFSVKASRYITHMKRLRDPEASLERFLSNVAYLGEKLGVLLFQLPPSQRIDLERLENFLSFLPENRRCVFEFREDSWQVPEVYALLQKFGCANCIYELNGYLSPLEATANFIYVRLHGPGGKYQGNYSDSALLQWAGQCKTWLETHDVYIYFDNDEQGFAPFNAERLRQLLLSL